MSTELEGQSARPSFREMKSAQLQQEREQRQPEPAPPREDPSLANDEAEVPETPRETELLDGEELDNSQLDPENEAEAIEDTDYDESDDSESAEPEQTEEVQRLTEERDKAVEARQSMERDYRKKTHKLGEAVRANDQVREQLTATAQWQAQQAQQEVGQFQNVNWQHLQVNDPGQFEQLRAAYGQAQQRANNIQQQQQQLGEHLKQQREAESHYRAEVSRDVLATAIPSWGGEVYRSLSEFAEKEYDISADEFARIDDWRSIKPIYDAYEAQQVKTAAVKTVKKIGRKRGGAPAGKTAPDGQPRNARGQYQKAMAEARSKPGDKGAFRAMKAAQMNAERGKRR